MCPCFHSLSDPLITSKTQFSASMSLTSFSHFVHLFQQNVMRPKAQNSRQAEVFSQLLIMLSCFHLIQSRWSRFYIYGSGVNVPYKYMCVNTKNGIIATDALGKYKCGCEMERGTITYLMLGKPVSPYSTKLSSSSFCKTSHCSQ